MPTTKHETVLPFASKANSGNRGDEQNKAFHREVIAYWNERSHTYSNSIKDELCDSHFGAWSDVLMPIIDAQAQRSKTTDFKVLDLGCGPGFFEIMLSRNGYTVHGIDSSAAMISRAKENVAQLADLSLVQFYCGDVAELPFESNSYDVVMSRNVTWLMSDPIKAYTEWCRVLKPGGKMLVFDANWYTYLGDDTLNQTRINDQVDASILNWSDNAFASKSQEVRCENIAKRLPLTYQKRPAWDASILPTLGFTEVKTDEEFAYRVWNEGEQAFYATSLLFSVEASK